MIYFIQEQNHKKDKQRRPTLVIRQQNRRFFCNIRNTYFLLESQIFYTLFARTAMFTLGHIQENLSAV